MNIDSLLTVMVDWGSTQQAIRAIALVGSHARGTARPQSDVDLVCLVNDPAKFRTSDWISQIKWAVLDARVDRWEDRDYGMLWSRHIHLTSGLEAEVGFVPLRWANIQPIDAGTLQVMSDGYRILYDPDAWLLRLANAMTDGEG